MRSGVLAVELDSRGPYGLQPSAGLLVGLLCSRSVHVDTSGIAIHWTEKGEPSQLSAQAICLQQRSLPNDRQGDYITVAAG
jgi:hypothetical protein